MTKLEEDIKHCEEVLAEWQGCDEYKEDHERLLSYMKELLEYRNARDSLIAVIFNGLSIQTEVKPNPFCIDFEGGGHGV